MKWIMFVVICSTAGCFPSILYTNISDAEAEQFSCKLYNLTVDGALVWERDGDSFDAKLNETELHLRREYMYFFIPSEVYRGTNYVVRIKNKCQGQLVDKLFDSVQDEEADRAGAIKKFFESVE